MKAATLGKLGGVLTAQVERVWCLKIRKVRKLSLDVTDVPDVRYGHASHHGGREGIDAG